jgi:hypothetical protein
MRLLAPHLTDDNHTTLLAAARHKSKYEIEELIAALRPKPDARTLVRRVAAPTASPSRRPDNGACAPPNVARPIAPTFSPEPSEPVAPAQPQARVSTPLAPERYRMQFTVSREMHDRFRRAQALLRHAVPSGDAAEIFDRALILLVEQLERQRFAQTSRPRAARPSMPGTRHIPAAVRRAVWRRDGGRCAFVGTNGRCRETAFLEFHHLEPYAVGGEATVENVQLRCRAHNTYEARLFFRDHLVREWPEAWDSSAHTLAAERATTTQILERPAPDLLDLLNRRSMVRVTSAETCVASLGPSVARTKSLRTEGAHGRPNRPTRKHSAPRGGGSHRHGAATAARRTQEPVLEAELV